MRLRLNAKRKINTGNAKRKGFTLIELMVVVAILIVLASMGTIGVQEVMKSAKDAKSQMLLQQIATAMDSMRLSYGDQGVMDVSAEMLIKELTAQDGATLNKRKKPFLQLTEGEYEGDIDSHTCKSYRDQPLKYEVKSSGSKYTERLWFEDEDGQIVVEQEGLTARRRFGDGVN